MFEKLQAFSKVIVVPALALYLCGFICVTGYYAQFGIITFDIVNARFLIAGFNVLWPLALCLYIAWRISERFENTTIFGFKRSARRYLIYSEAVALPYFAAAVMKAYFSAPVSLHKESDPATITFQQPFATWDVAGKILSFLQVGKSDWAFIFAYAFYILFYSMIVVVPVTIAITAFRKWRRRKRVASNASPPNTAQVAASTTQISADASQRSTSPYLEEEILAFIGDSVVRKTAIIALDLFFLSILFSMSSFSWTKIRSEIFDVGALASPSLDLAGIFSWCFATIFGLLVLLQSRDILPRNASAAEFQRVLNPYILTDVLQFFVVPILLSIFLFGATIFPRIPFSIGGGEPRAVAIVFKNQQPSVSAGKTYLIGESGQFLFVVPDRGVGVYAYQISKDAVEMVQMLKGARPPAPTSPTTKSTPVNRPAKPQTKQP